MTEFNETDKRWARALMIIYPRTQRIVKMLEDMRMTRALGGFSEPARESLFEGIIEINYRIEGIRNAYVLVKNALEKISKRHKDVLIDRHVKNLSISEIAEKLDMSVRNGFRRYDSALKALYKAVCDMGYDSKKLFSEYADDSLVMNIVKRAGGKIYSKDLRKKKAEISSDLVENLAEIRRKTNRPHNRRNVGGRSNSRPSLLPA